MDELIQEIDIDDQIGFEVSLPGRMPRIFYSREMAADYIRSQMIPELQDKPTKTKIKGDQK